MKKKNTAQVSQPSGYVVTKNGKQYFVIGNLHIEIAEHFAENGKPIDHLIENVITHAASQRAS